MSGDVIKQTLDYSELYTKYRKVANSSRPLIVAAPLLTYFNLLSKIGPKKY